jgi:hypothetical protein
VSFVERLLTFKFELASEQTSAAGKASPATFPGGSNAVTLSGLRATAKIVKAGTPSLAEAQVQIWGVPLPIIKQLATLGMVFSLIPKNILTVQAGDSVSGLSTIFVGTIYQAWGAFDAQPDVPFQVQAHTLGTESVVPAAPASFTGSTDVPSFMQTLAGTMGCTFENNGVTAKLASPYFYGSPRSQADACAQAANINWFVDDTTLAIWPKGQARGGDIPVIAPPPEGNMVGYPSFVAYGIRVKTLFDKSIRFGAKFQIKSSIVPANGKTWGVLNLAHDLSTQQPDGDWYTMIGAWDTGYPQPAQQPL